MTDAYPVAIPSMEVDRAPAGVVNPFAGTALPDGWLWCDGASYAQEDYPRLFEAIGTTYGGDATTFNVPNIVGKFVSGAGPHSYAPGETGGEDAVTLTTGQIPAHAHTGPEHSHSGPDHVHAGPNHSHSGPEHNHSGPSHNHSGPSHNHSISNHTHSINPPATYTDYDSHTHNLDGSVASGSYQNRAMSANDTTGRFNGTAIDASSHRHVLDIASFTSGGSGTLTSGNDGTGNTGLAGTGNTGLAGTGDTGLSGTGNTSGVVTTNPDTGLAGTGETGLTGGDGSHENRPPFIALNHIIRT